MPCIFDTPQEVRLPGIYFAYDGVVSTVTLTVGENIHGSNWVPTNQYSGLA